jgi:hypothetical protein
LTPEEWRAILCLHLVRKSIMADARLELVESCVLAYAAPGQTGIPVSVFSKVARMTGKGSVMDTDMARVHGAILVAGKPADLQRLRTAPETVAAAAALSARLPAELSPQTRHWAVWGEQGSSSQCMFRALTGVCVPGAGRDEAAHPHDPSDLRRCILLLEAVPDISVRLGELASLSPQWAALVAHWPFLADTMELESPDWRTGRGASPKTSEAMSAILDQADGPPHPAM